MSGRTISDVNPNVLKPTRKGIIEHEEKSRPQFANTSQTAFNLIPEINSTLSISPAVLSVNSLVNAHSAITFLQEQHAEVLKGLHQQVEDLQKQCKGLQFALTLQLPYLTDDERARISILEKALHEKEQDCNDLRDELLRNEQKIHKLKKELHVKDQIEKQLKKELEKRNNYNSSARNDNSRDRQLSGERTRNHEKIEQPQPVPPPKDGRFKASVRPAALYRRLLGFGVRSIKDTSSSSSPERVQSSPSIDLSCSIQSTTSSIPQLPRLVGSTTSPLKQRPLIRQQLRVSNLGTGENQTLSIDQNPLTNSYRTSDQNQKNTY